MKNIIIIFGSFCLIFLSACDKYEIKEHMTSRGEVSFSVSLLHDNSGLKSTNCDDLDRISAAIVDIETDEGELVCDTKKIAFYKFNDDYISDPVSLNVGLYRLTKFLLVNSYDSVLFASPKESSAKAYLVENPLPIEFIIKKDQVTKVIPEVLSVKESTPEDFGYVAFGFKIQDLISFYLTVLVYNSITDNFELSDANLVITHITDTLFNNHIEPATNNIIIRDGYSKYKVAVFKPGFTPYIEFFTSDSLEYYYNEPLVILLEESYEPQPGPVAYYPFNGNAEDVSGNNNNGIVYGASCSLDRNKNPNSAFYFDGIDDYISIPGSPSLNPLNQLTIALWLRIDTIANRYTPVLHKGGQFQEGWTNREYLLFVENKFKVYAESAGDNSTHHFIGCDFPEIKAWFHFAAVFDRIEHKMKVYINGEKMNEAYDSYSTFNNNNDTLKIATWDEAHSQYAEYFKGYMDDIYIYNRALSDVEIYDIFSE